MKAKEQTCLFQDLSGTKYYMTSTNIKLFILKLFVTASKKFKIAVLEPSLKS
jgi:hypothetical protein